MKIKFKLNGQDTQTDVDPSTPLLWVIRDTLGMTGTKYGCGIGQCGACTVHLNGTATRSYSLPISMAEGKQITIIKNGKKLSTLGGNSMAQAPAALVNATFQATGKRYYNLPLKNYDLV